MIGALTAAAGLLVAAGIAKVLRPQGTAVALGHVRTTAVRVGAAAEVVIGVTALLRGGIATVAVAASYLLFAGYVIVAIRRGWSLSSCGCFGQRPVRAGDVAPSWLHVLVDLAFAGAALASVHSGAPVLLLVARPAVVTASMAQGTVIAGLAYLVLARLPQLRAELT